jgi:hypothetical protein
MVRIPARTLKNAPITMSKAEAIMPARISMNLIIQCFHSVDVSSEWAYLQAARYGALNHGNSRGTFPILPVCQSIK